MPTSLLKPKAPHANRDGTEQTTAPILEETQGSHTVGTGRTRRGTVQIFMKKLTFGVDSCLEVLFVVHGRSPFRRSRHLRDNSANATWEV